MNPPYVKAWNGKWHLLLKLGEVAPITEWNKWPEPRQIAFTVCGERVHARQIEAELPPRRGYVDRLAKRRGPDCRKCALVEDAL